MWYVKTKILIVEERSVLVAVEMLISKNNTIQQVLDRLRLTLKRYQAVPESYLARQPTVFKINGLEEDQFTALLHNEAQSHLLVQRMEKVKNTSIDFEEAAIYSSR